MNRKEAAELLPIIKAFCEGKQIQFLFDEWKDVDEIGIREFLENPELYRIKPETKYRPFKDAEECWAEMQKHQPFGWVKNKESQALFVCKAIGKFIAIGIEDTPYTYQHPFDTYTFADGTPFGVKVEE
jgi:hypothetical protein